MPKRKVEIEWDKPDDDNWLNVFTLELALRQVCINTRFKITDLDEGTVSKDSWKE